MKVIVANPRGFCAGVERAIGIVEAALDMYGSPIYVRHEIVHNAHVISSFAARGVVFVESVSDVPEGAMTIFSAHGVSPAVWKEASARELRIVDATCPLVIKVHQEVARHALAGRTVFLIGHPQHPEVIGTIGHYVEAGGKSLIVVENEASAEYVYAKDPSNVAYVTQTTLSVDFTAQIVAILRRRFPNLIAPHRQDICYATSNRQGAVRVLARLCDIVIVLGASHSSNSARLQEVAEAAGVKAYLIESDDKLNMSWFREKTTIGVSSGASVPEFLVQRLLAKFRTWWPDLTEERMGQPENLRFRMPRGLELATAEAARAIKATLQTHTSTEDPVR